MSVRVSQVCVAITQCVLIHMEVTTVPVIQGSKRASQQDHVKVLQRIESTLYI